MTSPLPPDPYAALGVSKDADLGQIRTAHRKLVLKYHPDRIKGDDSEEKNRAKNEFQKAQQAYELLADSSRRARYDDQLKLAELQKEKMMRESSRPTVYTAKSTAAPTVVRREMRSDGNYYEERAPPTSYFDSRDRFDDPLPQTSARKHEAPYEKDRKSSAPKSAEKKEKFNAKMASPVEGFSMRMAFQMKAKATQARERVRDGHAKSQETRDRERGRERSEKLSGQRSYAAEVESESDSDTVVPKQSSGSRRASPRMSTEPEPVKIRPSSGRRHMYDYDDDSYGEDGKWERRHGSAMDYISESQQQKRPAMPRNSSDAYVYWQGDHPTGRRSGSDSEKRPTSSRRTKAEDARPRPSMPVHSSAPSNLKPYVEERIPQRAKTTPYPTDREVRPTPSLGRSQTMPTNKPSRKDAAPTKGSNLKHSETTQQDSGYYSSSNPHTPDLKGYSPPPSRENSKKKGNSTTKYQIVSPESDDERASRVTKILDSDEDVRHSRYRSPEPVKRERERERDRDRDRDREDRDRTRLREKPVRTESDSRTRSARAPAQASYTRSEFRGPPVTRPKLFGEVSSDEKETPHSYSYDSSRVKTASYRAPATASYGSPRFRDDDDHAPGSTFREHVRYPHVRKQSTAY